MGNKRPSISVFFPAYNDAESIGALVAKSLTLLPTLTDEFEVIVINDGSTDKTATVLEDAAAASNRVRVIHHSENQGYGAALRSGFRDARNELIFYTDGDGQYDVNELSSLWSALTPDIDVVNGYKVRRADGAGRRWLGAFYNRLVHLLFRIPIRDIDCDFRLIRSSAMNSIELTADGGIICVELIHKLARAGCRFAEVPVNHYPRTAGQSQFFRPGPVLRMGWDLLSFWFRSLRQSARSRREIARNFQQSDNAIPESLR